MQMPATARPAGRMESQILEIVESADDAVPVNEIRTKLGDEGKTPLVGEAVRSLVSRGCILVTRDWELVVHPQHGRLH